MLLDHHSATSLERQAYLQIMTENIKHSTNGNRPPSTTISSNGYGNENYAASSAYAQNAHIVLSEESNQLLPDHIIRIEPKDRQYLRFFPELAVELKTLLGVRTAIIHTLVLLQIAYHINSERNMYGEKRKFYKRNKWWTYLTFAQLAEELKERKASTVRRAVYKLSDAGLLCIDNFNQRANDKTNWYALQYGGLNKLSSIRIEEKPNGKPEVLKSEKSDNIHRVMPALAQEIGLVDSMMLLQFQFLTTERDGYYTDGALWMRTRPEDIADIFPYIQKSTHNKTLKALVANNLLLENVTRERDRNGVKRQYRNFALNYTELQKLESITVSQKPVKEQNRK